MNTRIGRIAVGALLMLGLGLTPGIITASVPGGVDGISEISLPDEATPQTLVGSLRVVVMDKDGVPVPSVEVVVYQHHQGSWTYVARTSGTDIDGIGLIESLEPGLYKAVVGKGYSEVHKIGYIEEGKTTTVIIEGYRPAPKMR